MHNLTAFIRFHATQRPNSAAVIYEGKSISFAGLLDRAIAAARWLRGQGAGKNEIVAVVMKNSAGFLVIMLCTSQISRFKVQAVHCRRRTNPKITD